MLNIKGWKIPPLVKQVMWSASKRILQISMHVFSKVQNGTKDLAVNHQ